MTVRQRNVTTRSFEATLRKELKRRNVPFKAEIYTDEKTTHLIFVTQEGAAIRVKLLAHDEIVAQHADSPSRERWEWHGAFGATIVAVGRYKEMRKQGSLPRPTKDGETQSGRLFPDQIDDYAITAAEACFERCLREQRLKFRKKRRLHKDQSLHHAAYKVGNAAEIRVYENERLKTRGEMKRVRRAVLAAEKAFVAELPPAPLAPPQPPRPKRKRSGIPRPKPFPGLARWKAAMRRNDR